MPVIKPIHPGVILREDFLKPMKLSAYRLAKEIGVPVNRITAIIQEKRDISPETGLLLAKFFGVSESLWLNLQQHYDMEKARVRWVRSYPSYGAGMRRFIRRLDFRN